MSDMNFHASFGIPQLLLSFCIGYGIIKAVAKYGEIKPADTFDSVDVFWGPMITACFGGEVSTDDPGR